MRGYQKKVIYLKNTGSRDFEEAYFIIRPDGKDDEGSSARMIEEANRIVEENFGRRRRRIFLFTRETLFSFFIGLLMGGAIVFTLQLCFNII